ncbi:MAG: AmmeMemoRadiSam system protein B [Polyangiaceae bacterium]
MESRTLRAPVFAGRFYPGSAGELRATVDELLALGARDLSVDPPKAVVAPHAGYVYSGPIAGTAFAALQRGHAELRRVVLLGPSHRFALRSVALPSAQAFLTPLGPVEVDLEAAERLRERGLATIMDGAHAREHSLEVELPFLQVIAPKATVLPLVVGEARPAEVAAILDEVWGGDETAIVVSSDLSHYLPYANARAMDAETARAIERLEPVDPMRACGARPLAGLLRSARERGLRASTLDLRTSGDTVPGGRAEVVGYGAFAFYPHSGGDA